MAKKSKEEPCCEPGPGTGPMSCCNVEAMISIDERGQMVLPKEVRDKAGICPGDKLALVTWSSGDKIACIALIKTDMFTDMIQNFLNPMMGGDSEK